MAKQCSISVSNEEHRAIVLAAIKSGVTISNYVRSKLGMVPFAPYHPDSKERDRAQSTAKKTRDQRNQALRQELDQEEGYKYEVCPRNEDYLPDGPSD